MGKTFIEAMKYNNTNTANGMAAHSDTDNALFSLFVSAGASLRTKHVSPLLTKVTPQMILLKKTALEKKVILIEEKQKALREEIRIKNIEIIQLNKKEKRRIVFWDMLYKFRLSLSQEQSTFSHIVTYRCYASKRNWWISFRTDYFHQWINVHSDSVEAASNFLIDNSLLKLEEQIKVVNNLTVYKNWYAEYQKIVKTIEKETEEIYIIIDSKIAKATSKGEITKLNNIKELVKLRKSLKKSSRDEELKKKSSKVNLLCQNLAIEKKAFYRKQVSIFFTLREYYGNIWFLSSYKKSIQRVQWEIKSIEKRIKNNTVLIEDITLSINKAVHARLSAWQYDKLSALKILFYARDIAEGAGERAFFRQNLAYLLTETNNIDFIVKNLLKKENILTEIIRVDDLVYFANSLIGYSVRRNSHVDMIIEFLLEMLNNREVYALVAKWMPRKRSQYSRVVIYMRANGHITTFSSYRKLIASKTNVVEHKMAQNEWESIDLGTVPSIALQMYKTCFFKHNIMRPYLENLKKGKAKINAKRLTPDAIVKAIFDGKYCCMEELAEAQWQNLKELNDLPTEYRMIPVIDVSGSMFYPTNSAISIALGLGLFIAERNPNPNFRNSFITFSSDPEFRTVNGTDIISKVYHAKKAHWGGSTNIEATFELILDQAVKFEISNDDMPTHIIIFSDMQFDESVAKPDENSFEMINRMYAEAGYTVPAVIYWNINNIDSVPVKYDESGALLVSGSSQNALNLVLKKYYDRPIDLMTEAISSPRYDHITL